MKYICTITIIFISYLFISCDERITPKQEINPDLKIKTKFLTERTWQCTIVEVVGGNASPKILFSRDENIIIDSTYIDFYAVYYPDSTANYITTNGYEELMWEFQNNQTQLSITDNTGLTQIYDIKKITANTIELSQWIKKSDYPNDEDWIQKLNELDLPVTLTQYRVNYTFE